MSASACVSGWAGVAGSVADDDEAGAGVSSDAPDEGASFTSAGVTVCPAATDAATVAMPRGEAITRPWPIIDAAWSVPVESVGTVARKAGKPSDGAGSRPSDRAAARRSSCDTVAAWPTNAVLHEWANAVRSGMSPSSADG